MDGREIRPGLAEVRNQTPAQKPFDRLTRLGVPPVDELRFVGPVPKLSSDTAAFLV